MVDDKNPFSIRRPPSDAALNIVSLEFPYEVLYNATEGFSINNKIGYGSYGTVYKGTLPDGTIVAIKLLHNPKCDGFMEEVKILSKYRHPNLVILMGFARHQHQRLLIYEYLPYGTLYDKLHHITSQKDPSSLFLYHSRIKVLRSVARGLCYLHTRNRPVYHRDIKSQNILLLNGPNNDDAKIADFGLSVLANPFLPDNSATVEGVAGTPGYICPYYVGQRRPKVIDHNTDVYAFGMLILETLTALSPAYYDTNFIIQYNFTMEDTTSADVWSRIDNTAEWPHFIIGELINLALNCINVDLNKRPPFSQITQVLDKILEIEDWTNAETTRLIINQPNTINNIKNDLDHLSPSTIGSDNVVVAAHFGPNWDTLVLEDRHHQESALQGHYHDGEHNDQDDDEEEDSDDDDVGSDGVSSSGPLRLSNTIHQRRGKKKCCGCSIM